ncbi:MAG: ABC transporter ATP-binding protein [Candidatus Eremiobacteraeota bacterium]|nr:ABC transporter ATP-binding protein [Candidatus Eremiobacteraeota bacterium]
MDEIRLDKLTKRFGDLVAVDQANLTIGQGEVMCLLGPSGCGKTTMLRMIAGLDWATSGDIWIAGKRVNDLPARERNVAMTFQFYALYPSLPVEDNLAYPLYAENLSKAQIAERVARVSEALDLKSILARRPYQLSEGEKQRVAVGRSIVREPTCFLFDEPLSRLDIQLRQVMRTQIKEVLTKLDKPTVIVTHDQIEALTMADRIAVMQRGKIEQVATPDELFSRPTNLFVAGFIGTPQMNLLPAVLIEAAPSGPNGSASARFSLLGEQIAAVVNGGVASLEPGAKITLGIRPRSFEFARNGSADVLHAAVDLIEPLGAETLVHLIEQGVDMRCVVPSTIPISVGERVSVRCKSGQLHVFDAAGKLVG